MNETARQARDRKAHDHLYLHVPPSFRTILADVHADDVLANDSGDSPSKNALFYKTPNGAHVGDLFMSLIHTCELEGANPFQYLTALQRHTDALPLNPTAWLPWNYRDTLAVTASG